MSGLSESERETIRLDLLREMAGDHDAVDWALGYIGKHVEAICEAREAAWRGDADGLRARVEGVADWYARKEADHARYRDEYAEGARDAYDVAESHLRDALSASHASAGVTTPGSDNEGRRTAHSDPGAEAFIPTSIPSGILDEIAARMRIVNEPAPPFAKNSDSESYAWPTNGSGK